MPATSSTTRAPSGYTNLSGIADIDYYAFNAAVTDYRPSDQVDIEVAPETRRISSTRGINYKSYGLECGWLAELYAHVPERGQYLVYLRYGSLADQTVELDLVTSDRTQPNQTVSTIGIAERSTHRQ